jgi:hypothetical protein
VPHRIVFPFHSACFEVLTRAITGSPDFSKIDQDILYSTFADLVIDDDEERMRMGMGLDYGDMSGQSETDDCWYWTSVRGEEVNTGQ